MTLTLTPELEREVLKEAQVLGTTPEALALERLQRAFSIFAEIDPLLPFEPQDDWERRLLSIGKDCGVSLSNEAVSSEGLYE